MLRWGAYKQLENLFIRQIKWTFNLPSKGKREPIEYMFDRIHPEHLIISNYIKNYNKWYQVEEKRLKERCERNH